MHITRVFRAGIVAVGLGCFGMVILPGCGDDTPSGGVVKTDKVEAQDREKMIENAYKSNPPAKGPGGKLPPSAVRK